jgi:hypothetical protein
MLLKYPPHLAASVFVCLLQREPRIVEHKPSRIGTSGPPNRFQVATENLESRQLGIMHYRC